MSVSSDSVEKGPIVVEADVVHDKRLRLTVEEGKDSLVEELEELGSVPGTRDGTMSTDACVINGNEQGNISALLSWALLLSSPLTSNRPSSRAGHMKIEARLVKEDDVGVRLPFQLEASSILLAGGDGLGAVVAGVLHTEPLQGHVGTVFKCLADGREGDALEVRKVSQKLVLELCQRCAGSLSDDANEEVEVLLG